MAQQSMPQVSHQNDHPTGRHCRGRVSGITNRLVHFLSKRDGCARASLVLTAVASLAAFCGCSKPAVRYTPIAIAPLPAQSFSREWLADLSITGEVTQLDVRDETLYVFSSEKHVTSIDRKSGKIKFVVRVESSNTNLLPPLELPDRIIFPTTTSLEIYDKKGGLTRSIALTSPLRSRIVGSATNIYFGSDDPSGGRVIALDLSAGFDAKRWQLLTPGGAITAAPCLYLGIVYIANEAGDVYAVSEDGRKAVWGTEGGIFKTYGSIVADLKADTVRIGNASVNELFIASRDSNLYCVNASTGKLLWQYFSGASLVNAPILTPDLLYQYVPGKGLAAIEKNSTVFNRTPRWIYPSARQFLAQDEKYAYLMEPRSDGADDSIVHHVVVAVNKETGKKAFESRHDDFGLFGTNAKDDLIYVAYPTGQVLALKPVLSAGKVGELVLQPVTTPLAAAN